MSLNMYLGEVQAQTESMNASCNAIIESMEQVIQSIDSFVGDAVLQGKTYDSAKMYFLQTFRPLAQGIIYLCEELIHQNNAFPTDFQAEVATVDVIEQEILEQIRELERMIAEVQSMSAHMSGMDALLQVYYAMKRKLEDKLERLYQFNVSSSDNYATAMALAANIAKGLAEVQSGKGFSPVSGTFSTKELNMEWIKPIQAITEEKIKEANNKIKKYSPKESIIEEIWGNIVESTKEKIDAAEDIWDKTVDFTEQAFETTKKISNSIQMGSGQAVGDEIEGWKTLSNPDLGTVINTAYNILHLNETVQGMWHTFSDSFKRDVINGDVESATRWITYALTHVGIGIIGDKGLGQVGLITKGVKGSGGSNTVTKGLTLIKEMNKADTALQKILPHLQPNFSGIGSTQHYYQKAATYTYEGADGPKTIRLRMGDLAGGKHPVTGIPYDADGFPIFEAKGEVTLKEKDFKKSRSTHDRICSKALYEQIIKDPKLASNFTEEEIELFKHGEVPDRFTWHHHQDTGRMQLVDSYLHEKTGHTGGYRIWGKDSDK
ncbi:hypothetical protein BAMA_23980 [Bacillus manliponensis]|uniref:LXG domain-containing protein n=1 Tax=Bacillus manliponensis TaxID=574376 RepID=A0A073JXS7_9BACI|nr:HNH endonuclease [Bacillus manliponensis]KEK19075.1 hypothetical protein BAMA_23980 [Bacillus manliponensis]